VLPYFALFSLGLFRGRFFSGAFLEAGFALASSPFSLAKLRFSLGCSFGSFATMLICRRAGGFFHSCWLSTFRLAFLAGR